MLYAHIDLERDGGDPGSQEQDVQTRQRQQGWRWCDRLLPRRTRDPGAFSLRSSREDGMGMVWGGSRFCVAVVPEVLGRTLLVDGPILEEKALRSCVSHSPRAF